MLQPSREDHIFIVESFTIHGSVTKVVNDFKWKRGRKVTRVTVRRTLMRWKSTGSIKNDNKGNSGRPLSARIPDNIDRVDAVTRENNRKSVRRISGELGLSVTSVWRIMKIDLGLTAYQTPTCQQLREADYAQRELFCRRALRKTIVWHNHI